MTKKLKLNIRPEWNEIGRVKEMAYSFLKKNRVKPDIINSTIMITSELIENAIKYGSYRYETGVIGYELDYRKKNIIIEVSNRIDEYDNNNLTELDHTIQWIRGYQNPMEAYIEKLKEVASIDLDHEDSGLGLVRIAYEGQAMIDFFLDENGEVCVSAEIRTT